MTFSLTATTTIFVVDEFQRINDDEHDNFDMVRDCIHYMSYVGRNSFSTIKPSVKWLVYLCIEFHSPLVMSYEQVTNYYSFQMIKFNMYM